MATPKIRRNLYIMNAWLRSLALMNAFTYCITMWKFLEKPY